MGETTIRLEGDDELSVEHVHDGKLIWISKKDGSLEICVSRQQAAMLAWLLDITLKDSDPEFTSYLERLKESQEKAFGKA